jgi:glycyl-tRNA synthetase beta chain
VTGTAVALADKLETLVGIWAIGLQPTGDKDPFALRRHALGVLRMLIEKRLPLSISGLLADAARSSPPWPASRTRGRRHRLHARPPARHPARARLLANEIEAVVAQNPDRLDDIVQRLEAVQAFAALPESASLAAANKRITNILKKNEEAGCRRQQASTSRCCRTWPKEPERRRGARAAGSRRRLRQGDFTGTLKTLAQLKTTSTPSSTT